MTIREMEWKSGLDRANIRFYEKEGLLEPERRENGYRDYSEDDLKLLLKIKLLRRLGFSLDAIRALKEGNTALEEALAQRLEGIGVQRRELNATEQVCREMRQDGAAFPTLDAERYLRAYDSALRLPSTGGIRPTVPDSDRVESPRIPWRRYLARGLDLSLMSILSLVVLSLVFRVNISRINTFVDWLIGLVQWGLLIVGEGFLLSHLGTTPGKWLMGIHLEDANGGRLRFGQAAYRAWLVFVKGEGCTIPIYNIVRLWKSYKAVRDGDGPEWDEDVTLVVRDWRWWRAVAYIAAVAAAIGIGILAVRQACLPVNRGDDLTVEEFVENYNKLASFYDVADGMTLQADGTFAAKESTSGSVVVSLDELMEDGEALRLRFTEVDGVVTGVSYEREYSTFAYGILPDGAGKQAIQLSFMALAWADCNQFEAIGSTDTLEQFNSHKEGALEEDILGWRLTYAITDLGEAQTEDGGWTERSYHVSFHMSRDA